MADLLFMLFFGLFIVSFFYIPGLIILSLVKFKLINEENTYLTAWSTTPWTILGNVALAVNSDLNYVKIKLNDEFLILAEERLRRPVLKNRSLKIKYGPFDKPRYGAKKSIWPTK